MIAPSSSPERSARSPSFEVVSVTGGDDRSGSGEPRRRPLPERLATAPPAAQAGAMASR